MEDCIAVLLAAEEVNLVHEDILGISRQTGGLFNFLLRVETSHGVFFYKQYLDNEPNALYDPPKIPASARALLACEVQRLALESTRLLGTTVIPKIVHFDHERSAFLMTEADGGNPLIDLLSSGEIPDVMIVQLPKVLACLHQATYGRFPQDSFYGNRAFRDFKLQLQYDDIASRLDQKESDVILRCREHYQACSDCVTHGDINSRNILVGQHTIEVIDFEQSHLGTPAYDLAYILSEVFISMECFGQSTTSSCVISQFLDNYFEYFHAVDRDKVETEMTVHFVVQTLYRFWGPSRASWTFYVEDGDRERIIRRSRSLLFGKGPISELLK